MCVCVCVCVFKSYVHFNLMRPPEFLSLDFLFCLLFYLHTHPRIHVIRLVMAHSPAQTPSPIKTARSHVSAISSGSPRGTQPRHIAPTNTPTNNPTVTATTSNESPRSVRSYKGSLML